MLTTEKLLADALLLKWIVKALRDFPNLPNLQIEGLPVCERILESLQSLDDLVAGELFLAQAKGTILLC